jgi:hypothetical protein
MTYEAMLASAVPFLKTTGTKVYPQDSQIQSRPTWSSRDTASPPVVRHGFALPLSRTFRIGLCPRFGLALSFRADRPAETGQRPNQGHSPTRKKLGYGKAEPCLTTGGRAAWNLARKNKKLIGLLNRLVVD